MDNQLNRYYRKIPTILQINLKTIHQKLWDPVLHHLQHGRNLFVKEEKMPMIIIDLLAFTIPIYR